MKDDRHESCLRFVGHELDYEQSAGVFVLDAPVQPPSQRALPPARPGAGTGFTSLAHYTGAHLIVPCLGGRDKAAVLRELIGLLGQAGHVSDVLAFYNAVLNREFYGNTAVGEEVTLPHARSAGVRRVCFALGRCPEPIGWGPGEAGRVRLIFLLAAPEHEEEGALRLCLGLTNLVRDRQAMVELKAATSVEEALAVFERFPLRPA